MCIRSPAIARLVAAACAVVLIVSCGQKSGQDQKHQKSGQNSQPAGEAPAKAPTPHPAQAAPPYDGPYGLGTPVSEADIAAWNIDVMADGRGLPAGRGSANDGASLYTAFCVACHGKTGVEGPMGKLAGGIGSLSGEAPTWTVGSSWPYAPTLFDYIRRTMPLLAPQSLTDDQTYALTAYVLFLNGLVEEDTQLDAASLSALKMPNRDGFASPDPRPDTANTACMNDCDPSL